MAESENAVQEQDAGTVSYRIMNTTKRKDQEIRQACEVLGLAENAHAEEIRRRYRLLMHSFHPDTAVNTENAQALAERARQINDAYQTLKSHGRLLKRQSGGRDPHIRCNEAAFCSRRLYMEEELYGEAMYIDTGLYGRYTWDPEMESFPMLLKSVHEAARKVLEELNEPLYAQEHRQKLQTKLLHLLLQEFVEPELCLEMLAFCREVTEEMPLQEKESNHFRSWQIRCHVRMEASCAANIFSVSVFDNKLFAVDEAGRKAGQITFYENELYYIVTPLIMQNAAKAAFELPEGAGNRRSGILVLKVIPGMWKDPTPAINREIAAMLQRY